MTQPRNRKTQQRTSEQLPDASVLYLRVSDVRQTKTAIDIDPEGNSIATQRVLGEKKAASLNAPVSKTFVEPGISARSVEKRKAFQELMEYLPDHPEVKYVIVYARSRAFRNYFDGALVKRQLEALGVKIISIRENFGDGIFAEAMEAITDVFNEVQSRQSGEDISIKMRHKAENGGTIGRARVGYLNARHEIDGFLVNTIAIDPKRGPLVALGFELYATGEYTLERLATAMEDRGLTTRPSAKRAEQPVTFKQWHRMLQDPYYVGFVTYKDEQFPGRHEPLVSHRLFAAVQTVLANRSKNGSRERIHRHYLRGLLFCQRCHERGHESRLIYTESTGRGGTYQYFACTGRTNFGCDMPTLAAWQIENKIIDYYETTQPPAGFVDTIEHMLAEALSDAQRNVENLKQSVNERLARLDSQEGRLLDLLADGTLPSAKVRTRLHKIETDRARLAEQAVDVDKQLAIGSHALNLSLAMMTEPHRTYLYSEDDVRRSINDALHEAFYFNEHGQVAEARLKPAFKQIVDAYEPYRHTRNNSKSLDPMAKAPADSPATTSRDASLPELRDLFEVRGSNKDSVVEHSGFEPLTSSLPAKRSSQMS